MRNALLVLALALSQFRERPGPGPLGRHAPAPGWWWWSRSIRCGTTTSSASSLCFTGGFRTLIERGAVFSNARYRHANCETGPGHSVILSGRNAWQSGIVANAWYDSALGRAVNVVDDPDGRPVGGKGRGASPANFIGFTLGDMLKKAYARGEGGGGLHEGPVGHPHGRPARRRRLLVRAGDGPVHHQQLLHEGGARLAGRDQRTPHSRRLRGQALDETARATNAST